MPFDYYLQAAETLAPALALELVPLRSKPPPISSAPSKALTDLAQWVFEEFHITIAKQTLTRELRAIGYRKLSAGPRHHVQVDGAIENFKKVSPRVWRQSRARRPSIVRRQKFGSPTGLASPLE
jgi:hypothetical protein